jgi:hypothetical protein
MGIVYLPFDSCVSTVLKSEVGLGQDCTIGRFRRRPSLPEVLALVPYDCCDVFHDTSLHCLGYKLQSY